MKTLYDTSAVHALDRFDYYRTAVVDEVVPDEVVGPPPGRFSAVMTVGKIGEATLESFAFASEEGLAERRTERLIRVCDPRCLRLLVSVHGGMRMRQQDHTVDFRAREVALYDTSRPFHLWHLPSSRSTQFVMYTFPRTLLAGLTGIEEHVGSVFPRGVPGRDTVVNLMIELARPRAWVADHLDMDGANVLQECAVGLVRARLGQPAKIPPLARRLTHLVRIRAVIRSQLTEPTLDPEQIARAAHISRRYLHQILASADTTPMKLVKELRLAEARRHLADPAMAGSTIRAIASMVGYPRQDQFARDFKEMFGTSAKGTRPR